MSRSVHVKITADQSAFVRGMEAARQAALRFNATFTRRTRRDPRLTRRDRRRIHAATTNVTSTPRQTAMHAAYRQRQLARRRRGRR